MTYWRSKGITDDGLTLTRSDRNALAFWIVFVLAVVCFGLSL